MEGLQKQGTSRSIFTLSMHVPMLSSSSTSLLACPKAAKHPMRSALSGCVVALASVLICSATLFAQGPALAGGEVHDASSRQDPSDFDRARHHFDHHQYAAAIELFDAWVQDPVAGDGAAGDRKALLQVEAEYRAALCAMYLYHKDAVWRIDRFIERHPESTWVPKLQWALANYEYRRSKWSKAIVSFDALNPRRLSKSMRTEYHFKRGHARFETGDLEGARGDLLRVKEDPAAQPEFLEASEYYLAHIAFAEDRLTTAMEAFESLSAIDAFKDAVPLYIGQILYRLERFEELAERGPSWLAEDRDLAKGDQKELTRILGEAFFHLGDCTSASPYLESAWTHAEAQERTAGFSYIVGTCRLSNGNPSTAITALMRATGGNTPLDQYATHAMGRAYLELNEKPKAQSAFAKAATMDHDLEMREDALFNQAKLAFETDFNPFNDAIAAFEQYLNEYPDSPRRDEAYGFLLDVYLTTRNHVRALDALDKIQRKSPKEKKAYQKLAYNHGVDLFQSGQTDEADAFFKRSRSFPEDATLAAESHYWQGEIAMKSGSDAPALSHYRTFLNAPGAFNSTKYNEGEYGAGYALFRQRKYRDAQVSFRKYADAETGAGPGGHRADALLRIGDCFYIDKDYGRAVNAYDKALDAGTTQQQYTRYQRAKCLGLNGDLNGQVEGMTGLLEAHPQTTFKGDALTAIGKAEIERNRMNEARSAFEQIRSELPGSPFAKRALVDLALVAIKQNREDDALALWQTISTQYPDDEVTKDAFLLVEPLLVERGQLDNLPDVVGLSEDDIAERTYAAAQDLALSGDCAAAAPKLEQFIDKYPNSIRLLAARFHLGQCHFDNDNGDGALEALEAVIAAPLSDYHEPALVMAATLRYNRDAFDAALEHYRQLEQVAVLKRHVLEARIGIMRCSRALGDGETVLSYVDPILDDSGTPADIRTAAHYNRALILLDRNDPAAKADLEVLAAGGPHAEEATHQLAVLILEDGDPVACQAAIFEQLNRFGGGSDWSFHSFLLLAETYIVQEDYFQARTTIDQLQSNVQEPWVQEACLDMLDRIVQLEQPPTAPADSTSAGDAPNSDEE